MTGAGDPYQTLVPTTQLGKLAGAFDVVDHHAELNHRYRKLITDTHAMLASEEVRLTQARGMAKKLMVLVRKAGPDFRADLPEPAREALDAGVEQAHELVYGR